MISQPHTPFQAILPHFDIHFIICSPVFCLLINCVFVCDIKAIVVSLHCCWSWAGQFVCHSPLVCLGCRSSALLQDCHEYGKVGEVNLSCYVFITSALINIHINIHYFISLALLKTEFKKCFDGQRRKKLGRQYRQQACRSNRSKARLS